MTAKDEDNQTMIEYLVLRDAKNFVEDIRKKKLEEQQEKEK